MTLSSPSFSEVYSHFNGVDIYVSVCKCVCVCVCVCVCAEVENNPQFISPVPSD